MVISGGAGAAPTDPMKACRSGFEKNCWNCPAVSHSFDYHDETVANPETMLHPACRAGHVGDLRELAGPVSKSLAERSGVALEFPDNQHAHCLAPSVNSARPEGSQLSGRDTSPG